MEDLGYGPFNSNESRESRNLEVKEGGLEPLADIGDLGAEDSVPKICDYTVCPRDGKDHRTLVCAEMCPYKNYPHEPLVPNQE